MFHLFSDIFANRENPLTRIDPRAKLVIGFTVILSVILSTKVTLPLLVFGSSLLAIVTLRIPFRLILFRLGAPLSIVAVLVLLQSFLVGSTPLLTLHLGGWKITATREGLLHGLLLGCRVLGAVSVILLLSFTTPAHKIFHSLLWLHVPREWVEVAMMMYRYTFILLEVASDMAAAQRVRIGYSGIKRSLSSIGILAGGVIIRSVDQGIRSYEAMVARGYKGSVPFGPMAPLSRRDGWATALLVLAVAGAFLTLEWRPW